MQFLAVWMPLLAYLCATQLYQDQHKSPPLCYNMPPMSGKIMWSRQLFKHLEAPMEKLKARNGLFDGAQGKALVRKYNRIALVLTEYEVLHYRGWVKIIDVGKRNMQVGGWIYTM